MELKAFLSHRYKSPEVNLYFHKLFAESAEIQFEVDVGPLPTCVTRLERMIRDADAFIGIYPFPGDPKESASSQDLRDASKYFRLECELATRSGKPALIFLDKRYAPYFRFSPSIRVATFDVQEICGRGGSPSRLRFQLLLRDFCEELTATMAAIAARRRSHSEMHVGIIVPTIGPAKARYESRDVQAIEKVLGQHGVSIVKHFSWPPQLHSEYLDQAEALDWIVIDIGPAVMNSGIVGYLHGRFIPMIRLIKSGQSRAQVLKHTGYLPLFGGIEVGYSKDVVVWNDTKTLIEEIDHRLVVLNAPVERVTRAEAESYFRRASLRKEPVFLSYSSRDSEIASRISQQLKKRFQQVFDYRDGESITPGEPWLKEIFDKLSVSTLGIPLVSSNYFKSGNCAHEAQEMVSRRDSAEMSLIPLKLYAEDNFERPSWMSHRQYMHYYDYPDVETVVEKLVEFFDRAKDKQSTQ